MLDPGALGTLMIGLESVRHGREDARPSHNRPHARERGRLVIRRQVAATLHHMTSRASITVPKSTRRVLRP
jgi:hypothetical protein